MVAIARQGLSPSLVSRLSIGIAPLGAALGGLAIATAFLLLPESALESLVTSSGVASLIPAAEPPLGFTARTALAIVGGGGFALFLWFGLFLMLGDRSPTVRADEPDAWGDAVPAVRRADAHPDAPPRAPVLATRDLGVPFLDVKARKKSAPEPAEAAPLPMGPAIAEPVEIVAAAPEPEVAPAAEPEIETPAPLALEPAATPEPTPESLTEIAPVVAPASVAPEERQLPANLNEPLAAYDPEALPEVPLPAPKPLPPLSIARPAVFDAGERFETFELTPPVRTAPVADHWYPNDPAPEPWQMGRADDLHEPLAAAETDATIHALLARLEAGVESRGLARKPRVAPEVRETEHGLEEALNTLRKLAMRA